jgi:pyruvate dehydrogenase E1 component
MVRWSAPRRRPYVPRQRLPTQRLDWERNAWPDWTTSNSARSGSTRSTAATWCSAGPLGAGHLRPRLLEAGSARSSSTASARRSTGEGLSSYPHPWLMPGFWQFPTVSMGSARSWRSTRRASCATCRRPRVLNDRRPQGLGLPRRRRDGRARVLGAISLAARERLDNLVFVVNCNLQRLDGPVRGNGKIIQELEASLPRRRLERHQGHLGQLLGPAAGPTTPRAAAQAHGGVRRRRLPGLQGQGRRLHPRAFLRQVSRDSRPGRQHVRRGHLAPEPRRARPVKVFAAYAKAMRAPGPADGDPGQDRQGLRHGRGRRGQNITHSQKKMGEDALKAFRDRFNIPISDEQIENAAPFSSRRGQPRDEIPARAPRGARRPLPARDRRCRAAERSPARRLQGAARRQRRARDVDHHGVRAHPHHLLRDKTIGKRVVPIVPDEAAPSAWRACSASSASTPTSASSTRRQDSDQVMYYREEQERPDPAGGHQRGRRHVVLDRRGTATPTTARR